MNELDVEGSTECRQARLWIQAEWLKAALLLHDCSNGESRRYYREQIGVACGALSKYLTKPVAGLWFDKLHVDDGLLNEKVPASTLYHIATAIYQLKASADIEQRQRLDPVSHSPFERPQGSDDPI